MTASGITDSGAATDNGHTARYLTAHYVYQRIHTLAGKPLHLAAHLDLAARAMQHIYGMASLAFDERAISSKIAETLRANRFPAKGSATVILFFIPRDAENFDLTIEPERPLLDAGYSLSSLRPRAVSHEYDIPFGGFPTGFQLSAARLYATLASSGGASRSVRRCGPHGQTGDRLLTCGDAPLFAIKGRTLFTASFTEGAMDSVERHLTIEAAAKARLNLMEEAPRHYELKTFDELFYADAAGITSFSECDGAKFMSLVASRLIENFRQ